MAVALDLLVTIIALVATVIWAVNGIKVATHMVRLRRGQKKVDELYEKLVAMENELEELCRKKPETGSN